MFHCTGRYELNKLTLLPMFGFIAQLVEHRTGIAEVMGSNPVEAMIFFRLLLSNCLNWKIYCDDHTSLSNFGFVSRFSSNSQLVAQQICSCPISALHFFNPQQMFLSSSSSARSLSPHSPTRVFLTKKVLQNLSVAPIYYCGISLRRFRY